MGEGCKVQGSAYIADDCQLGDRVFIGPAAVILNDKYPPSNDRGKWQPVHIGDEAVIGGNATIVPGNNVGTEPSSQPVPCWTRPAPSGRGMGGTLLHS